MKKSLIFGILFLMMMSVVSAANVAVVALLADGSTHTECVNIDDGANAYDAFQETTLTMTWSNSGFGRFLESVEGVASDDTAGKYWSFWHQNTAETDFESSMVGASDYDIDEDGHVIGISYTAFDNSFLPITKPGFQSYDSLCENKLNVKSIKIYVDEDKTTANENGDDFEVKPGSVIRMEIKLENDFADKDINDIEVVATIYEIDDGDDLEEDDSLDLNDGEDDTIEFTFDVPIEIDEDTYDMVLTIEGTDDDGLVWRYTYNFDVELDKEKHELVLDYPSILTLVCGQDASFSVKTINLGADDEQDVVLRVSNLDLNIEYSETFDVDENEQETQTIRLYDAVEGKHFISVALEYEEETLMGLIEANVECATVSTSQTAEVQQQDSGMVIETVDFVAESAPTTTSKSLNITSGGVLLVLLNLILVAVLVFLVNVLRK